jgi:hypothetical protein
MSPISQPKIGRVLYSGKIDGGASRALEMPDGSLKIETWGPDGWVEGGASLDEFMLAPPVRVTSRLWLACGTSMIRKSRKYWPHTQSRFA